MHVGLDRPPVAEASVKNVFEMTYPILDLLLAGWWTVLLTSVGVTHKEALGTQKCLHTRIGVRGGAGEIARDHALHEERRLGEDGPLAYLALPHNGLDCASNTPTKRHVRSLGRFL